MDPPENPTIIRPVVKEQSTNQPINQIAFHFRMNDEWIWAPNRTLRKSCWEKIASVPTGSNTTLLPPYSSQSIHDQFTINSRSIHDQFTYPYPTLDLIFEYRGSFGINHMNCTGWVLRRNQLFQERLLLTSSYYANCLDVKTEGRGVYTPRSHWQDLTQ